MDEKNHYGSHVMTYVRFVKCAWFLDNQIQTINLYLRNELKNWNIEDCVTGVLRHIIPGWVPSTEGVDLSSTTEVTDIWKIQKNSLKFEKLVFITLLWNIFQIWKF
jgi:hypothetical protein